MLKNINAIIFNLATVQMKVPRMFVKSLPYYIQLLDFILNNIQKFQNEKLTKLTLIALKKLHHSFSIRVSLYQYRKYVQRMKDP